MQIERILFPIKTLGPGDRFAMWTIGCSKRCPNCLSPEMWRTRDDKDIPISQLIGLLKDAFTRHKVDGITISGGEPLDQAAELLLFLSESHKICRDILVYTGYTMDELRVALSSKHYRMLVDYTAVLIDGRYIDELNDGASALIGSTNQNINYFSDDVKAKYEEYIESKGRQLQNVYCEGKIISVGIHSKER